MYGFYRFNHDNNLIQLRTHLIPICTQSKLQQPEVVKRDIRFARQLRIASKVKVPFPHCLSVVMRDQQSNSLQMLTQGTADIVLECCDDFWDGKDLRSLGPQERKRAQVRSNSFEASSAVRRVHT